MLRHALKLHVESKYGLFFSNITRFKGHSHWQNTRHVKQENDNKRSALISMYMRKIQGVVNAKNGDANPATNSALANVLEEAKKNNLPNATFQNYMKKLNDTEFIPQQIYYRGFENYTLAITFNKKRVSVFRQGMKKACRDFKVTMQELSNADDVFTTKGIILSKAPSPNTTLAQAEEAAIIAGAEEVDPIESADEQEKVFQFITLFEDLFKVVQELKGQGWTIYEHKLELVPTYYIELPEETVSNLHNFVTYIEELPEVHKVVINIA